MKQGHAQLILFHTAWQVDSLSSKLVALEQQLEASKRREAEARSEASLLANSLSMAQQQAAKESDCLQAKQQQQLEKLAGQHAEHLAVLTAAKEAAAVGAAQAAERFDQERLQLVEQVSFLKMQLQVALQESDKVSCWHTHADACARPLQSVVSEVQMSVLTACGSQLVMQ